MIVERLLHTQPAPEGERHAGMFGTVDGSCFEPIGGRHGRRIVPVQIVAIDIGSGVAGSWIRIAVSILSLTRRHTKGPLAAGEAPARIGVEWLAKKVNGAVVVIFGGGYVARSPSRGGTANDRRAANSIGILRRTDSDGLPSAPVSVAEDQCVSV